MIKTYKYRLKPEIALDEKELSAYLSKKIKPTFNWKLLHRSIDARAKKVMVNIDVAVSDQSENPRPFSYQKPANQVEGRPEVIIVGAGPAGLFAALKCIELGVKPIVLERGKDVRERRRDLAAINKDHVVNPDSNYCFGEGGAGTYSDGKLYTRSTKRGDVNRILEILVAHGAQENILVDSHPHIGTNKLPKVIADIRETILSRGGEIVFDAKVVDLVLQGKEIKGVKTADSSIYQGLGVILSTGHSARDIFQLLKKHNIVISSKPFALGVRVEHSQQTIDKIQYHCDNRGQYLPAAAYSLSTQTQYSSVQRGVFSFCMCPGGFIVPSATESGEVVVNGMSPSRRDSKYANSGIVVAVDNEDLKKYEKENEFKALAFQSEIEKRACEVAGGSQAAPAQRLVDFLHQRFSNHLPVTSYQPGLVSADMSEVLPADILSRLKAGFKDFGKKSRGYITNEAVVLGVESRTSSPVHVPRHNTTLEHIEIKRLFPCGEGAGYAGGIMSAAIDGENTAKALVDLYNKA